MVTKRGVPNAPIRMWEATITKERLAPFVYALGALWDEAYLEVDDRGLYAELVDPAHIALVTASLSSECFSDWVLPEAGILGISLAEVKSLLRMAKKDDEIAISLPNGEHGPALSLHAQMHDQRVHVRRSTSFVNAGGQVPVNPPMLTFKTAFAISGGLLYDVTKACREVGDFVGIEATEEGVRFYADGDADGVGFTLEEISASEAGYKSAYPADMLYDCAKALRCHRAVMVKMATDYPVSLSVHKGIGPDKSRDGLSIELYVAPKVGGE